MSLGSFLARNGSSLRGSRRLGAHGGLQRVAIDAGRITPLPVAALVPQPVVAPRQVDEADVIERARKEVPARILGGAASDDHVLLDDGPWQEPVECRASRAGP